MSVQRGIRTRVLPRSCRCVLLTLAATHDAPSHSYDSCVALLVEAKADVDLQKGDGCTPLHAACYRGHPECCKLLMRGSASVGVANAAGFTPLLIACDQGHHVRTPPPLPRLHRFQPSAAIYR